MGIRLLLSPAAFKEILPVIADWTLETYTDPHFLRPILGTAQPCVASDLRIMASF